MKIQIILFFNQWNILQIFNMCKLRESLIGVNRCETLFDCAPKTKWNAQIKLFYG